jgi:hypothetical protein
VDNKSFPNDPTPKTNPQPCESDGSDVPPPEIAGDSGCTVPASNLKANRQNSKKSTDPRSQDAESGKIGYRHPPEHTRFQKGRSGNPNGRPKGTLNLATILERALREKAVIDENGRTKAVSRLEATVHQLTTKAASGDLGAIRLLGTLMASAEERSVEPPVTDVGLGDEDQKVFQGILKRLRSHIKEGA